MTKIIGFDCDETLEISNGPVSLKALMGLKTKGWKVGICGNWQLALIHLPNLDFYTGAPKGENLKWRGKFFQKKIFIGNGPEDEEAARIAGWQFIHVNNFNQELENL